MSYASVYLGLIFALLIASLSGAEPPKWV